jgi:uncharacterized membrane protein (UPF0127 family)
VIHRSGGTLRTALAGLAAVAVLTFAGCSSDGSSAPAASVDATTSTTAAATTGGPEGFGAVTLVVTMPDGTVKELCVWLADTPALRNQGLMAVTDPELGGASAMVFAFPGDTTSGFWMKDTLLPLSIAWYAADGSLVSTADMDPCPEGVTNCPVSSAAGSYRYAVEVPQGALDRLGLVEGSTVSLGPSCTPETGVA